VSALAAWYMRDNVELPDGVIAPLEPHKAIFEFGERLFSEQGDVRRTRADAALFMYYGNSRRGLTGSNFATTEAFFGEWNLPFRNIIQSCVDTKTAHIFRNKVRVFFLSTKGDSKLQEMAMGMTRAIEAGFTAAGFYATPGFKVCQDGQLFEGGGFKITPDFANNRVLCDRVFPWEVFVPEEEARYGSPRQIFHRQPVDRQVLIKMFPEKEREIRAAPSCPDDWMYTNVAPNTTTSDLVAVWEAWHLPSGRVDLDDKASFGLGEDGEFAKNVDPGHDGRHVIAIQDATLLDRPWPYDYFPFAWFLPQPDPSGFWSSSIPERLAGVQAELMKLGIRIRKLINLHAVPRMFISRGARLNKKEITNSGDDIIETSGPPSQAVWVYTPSAVPAELFKREQDLVEWAQQQVGISELSQYAQKPAGIDSGVGLQMLADTESIRHTPSFRAWEEFHLQAARAMVDCYRQLAEVNPDFEVIWGDNKDLKRIKWKSVDLDRSQYDLRLWPTNLLPSTPEAKASRVGQYVKLGVFTPQQALSALEFPDIEALLGDSAAMRENIERKLQSVVQDGLDEDNAPHAYLDLGMAKAIARERINRLEADGEAPSKVDDVRRWWDFADYLDKKSQAASAAAQQGQAPAPPPGAPPDGGPPQGGPPPGPGGQPMALPQAA